MISRRGSQPSATLFNYDQKIRDCDALQEKMNSADFWNNQKAARKTIEDFKTLRAQTDGLGAVITDFEDAQVGYELANLRMGSAIGVTRTADALVHHVS
jgi:hypothetical protein